MSNHVHLDVTDMGKPRGDLGEERIALLSDFIRDFKSLLARSGNCHLGRWEYFWSDGYGWQEVETRQAAVQAAIYTIGNPVRAGLVASTRAWPGLITTPEQLAVTKPREFQTFTKPTKFFPLEEDGGDLPDEVALVLHPHPLGAQDPVGFVRDIKTGVDKVVQHTRKQVKREGGRFRGSAAVVAQRWNGSPRTPAPRRRLNPRVAEPNPLLRWLMLARAKWFQERYDRARELWLATGKAVFPAGTHKMRSMPGVTVESSRSRPRLGTSLFAPIRG